MLCGEINREGPASGISETNLRLWSGFGGFLLSVASSGVGVGVATAGLPFGNRRPLCAVIRVDAKRQSPITTKAFAKRKDLIDIVMLLETVSLKLRQKSHTIKQNIGTQC